MSLLLFAKTAYTYSEMKNIEATANNIMLIMQSDEYETILTNNLGKPMIDKITGQVVKIKGIDAATLEAYEKFVKMMIYGQQIQSNDITVNVGEREISVIKGVQAIQGYIASKALFGNIISIAGNTIGSESHYRYKLNDGDVITKTADKKGMKLIKEEMTSKEPGKLAVAMDIIHPHGRGEIDKLTNKLPATRIEKILDSRNAYFMGLFHKADELLDIQVFANMLNGWGVDANGHIVKIDKAKDGKALIDLLERDEDGNWSFKGVPEDQLIRFRLMVQRTATSIKGQTPENDKFLAGTNLYMNMFLFFRNWIPGIAKSKFKTLQYDNLFEQMDEGRFVAAWQHLISGKGFTDRVKNIADILILNVAGKKPSLNKEYLETKFYEFLSENPTLKDKVTLEDFIKLNEQKLKGFATELRFLYVLLAIVSGAKALIPDDEEDMLTKLIAQNSYSTANRALLELTFWTSPKSVSDIISRPFSVLSFVKDLQNLGKNGLDEARDAMFGEDSSNDKTPPGYYLSSMFPILGPILKTNLDVFDSFNTNQ